MNNKNLINPFMPSFGRFPNIVLDQQEALTDYLTGLQLHDAKYQTSLVYGTRGAGKTVFLLNVERSLSKLKNWYFLRLNNGQGNLLFQLLHGLQRITGTTLTDLLKQIKGIDLMGTGISFQSQTRQKEVDYSAYLPALLKKLKKQGKSLLVGIDEIQISDDVRAFGSEYQTLIGEDYDISLLMTGLPSRVSEVQNDDTLTFLLRSNRVYLSPLDHESVINSYERVFKQGHRQIDYDILDKLANDVKGYAYAFQTLGYYAWRYSQQSLKLDHLLFQKIIKSSKKDLFRNAYQRMYQDLSKNDRSFISALIKTKMEVVPITKLKSAWQKPFNYLSVYRARLIDDQLIKAPRRGYVELALPFFAEFVIKYKQEHFLK